MKNGIQFKKQFLKKKLKKLTKKMLKSIWSAENACQKNDELSFYTYTPGNN